MKKQVKSWLKIFPFFMNFTDDNYGMSMLMLT